MEYISDNILIIKKGKLIINSPAENITHEMDRKVWKCIVDKAQLSEISSNFCVANLHHGDDDMVALRILSEEIPMDGAINEEPTLEDLYLYHFQNNITEYRGIK